MELNKLVCDAGILGAGGAGFPTHVKINCKAEFVLANGAECEPLLRVDQQSKSRCLTRKELPNRKAPMAIFRGWMGN